ncbi:MAG TPA: LacI family DNA-binding transcriptional regulator [Agriterribacter sp.]|nr:LacI family DNA-binding transcriptional regulator [Agriterribacter sp.]
MTTTLKKLAEVSGLSISTVSRALKNHPDISEKTKALVVELASVLDYEPDANAVHLRTKDNHLFGLIVPSVSNFFYDSCISAIEKESRKNNYSLMILQSGDNPDIELNNVRLCRQNRVSGLFACLSSSTENIDGFLKLKEVDIPVIFFDKVPERTDCHKVCVADTASATIAANAIISKRKKRILALFGNEQLLITKKRYKAFTETIQHSQEQIQLITASASSDVEAELLTKKNLDQHPDTIFCMSDEILTGVMKVLQHLRLKVPEEIAVIAISNGFIPTLYYPQITYVETSGVKLGQLAFSSMMTCLSGGTFTQDLTTESVLIEGGSL